MLRVKGFYRESVSESKVEIARTRKIEILFYLEDETIEVVEPKVINSGLPQGTFLKRHRVAKADGSFVTWEDILPGKEIALYGRVFSIVDCDGYTKEYFAENGVEVDASGSYPPNNLLAPPPPKVEETAAITMTQFAEAELGKHQHDSKAMKQVCGLLKDYMGGREGGREGEETWRKREDEMHARVERTASIRSSSPTDPPTLNDPISHQP